MCKTEVKHELNCKLSYLVSVASIAKARTVLTLPIASSATAVDLATYTQAHAAEFTLRLQYTHTFSALTLTDEWQEECSTVKAGCCCCC